VLIGGLSSICAKVTLWFSSCRYGYKIMIHPFFNFKKKKKSWEVHCVLKEHQEGRDPRVSREHLSLSSRSVSESLLNCTVTFDMEPFWIISRDVGQEQPKIKRVQMERERE